MKDRLEPLLQLEERLKSAITNESTKWSELERWAFKGHRKVTERTKERRPLLGERQHLLPRLLRLPQSVLR